jgi:hypothetical protein
MRPESAHPAHPACPSLPGLSPATWRPAPARAVACLAALAALATPFTLAGLPRPAHAQPAAPAPQAAAGTREVVTTADQLPRRTVRLDKLPSQYLDAPRAELQTMADALERNLRADLERYEIRDASTLRGYHGMLLLLAQFKGDWAAVPAAVETLRHLQDKPGQKATTGVLANLLAEQQAGGRDSAWVQAEVTRRYGALAWSDVADSVKAMRGQFELMNPALVKGGFEQQLDVMARNADKVLPEGIVATVLGARLQLELLMPQRQAVVAGLQAVIERHAQAEQRPDLWTPRQFSIAPGTPAAEVGIGVWDSGVDLSLFKPTPGRGIAFDADSRRSDALLRPLGEAAARWPQLEQLVKGAMDLQAALDTPDARQLKQVVAGLEAGQAKAFQEDLALAGLYTHGTHVAGIAVDGNPQARVFAASMLWSHRSEPLRPSEAHSQRVAQAYRDIVAAFRAEKLRVVNMSWRYGAAAYEGALAWHNLGASADERRQIARRLFAIERDALARGDCVGAGDPVRRRLGQRGQQRRLRRVHPGRPGTAQPDHRRRGRPLRPRDPLLDLRPHGGRARQRLRGREPAARRPPRALQRHQHGQPPGGQPGGQAVRAAALVDGGAGQGGDRQAAPTRRAGCACCTRGAARNCWA